MYVVPGRPGLLTTIGVLCIVVASLSIIASFITGCGAVTAGQLARQSLMPARMGTATPAPGVAMTTADAGANGFSVQERAVFINALTRGQPLSPARRQQLDTFLREHGRSVIQPNGVLIPRTVTGHLGGSGKEYAQDGNGPDYFVFLQGRECNLPGRLKLYDENAVYVPDDTTLEKLRSAYDPSAPPSVAPAYTPTIGLDPDDASAVVGEIKRKSNNKLNPAQAQSLQMALEQPSYIQWLTPSSTAAGLSSQVKTAIVQSNGTVTVNWANGSKTVCMPDGTISGMTLGTGTATTQPTNPFTTPKPITVSRSAVSLGVVEAIGSGIAALLLLTTGILVLRQAPASRWLLLLYSLVKIALAVTAIVAFSWLYSSLKFPEDSYFNLAWSGDYIQSMSIVGIVLASIGLLFPLVLMVVMATSKTVKDYYKTGTT
jgi:hypothetical protein